MVVPRTSAVCVRQHVGARRAGGGLRGAPRRFALAASRPHRVDERRRAAREARPRAPRSPPPARRRLLVRARVALVRGLLALSMTILGHPAGLFLLFLVEMWERFSY